MVFLCQLIIQQTMIKYESPKFILIKIKEAPKDHVAPKELQTLEHNLNEMIKLTYKNCSSQSEIDAAKEHIMSTCQ